MSYTEDWTTWAGDHPQEAEAELREEARRAERLAEHRRLASQPLEDRDGADSAAMYAMYAKERKEAEAAVAPLLKCINEDIHEYHVGVCLICEYVDDAYEPTDAQIFAHYGQTKVPVAAA